MDGFELELLNRLPLAEATWLLYRYVANDKVLNGVFEAHRGRGYERSLAFSTLVGLVADALLVHDSSARQSFSAGRKEGRLDVSDPAAYGKLRRTPVSVSEALLATVGDRMTRVVPVQDPRVLSKCFADFRVVTIDGKKLKNLAKRLKPLRGVSGSMLGGKVLVAIDGRSGLALAMSSALDGEANDAPLVPKLVPQVRQRVDGPRLWVADRQFCDLTIPGLLGAGGDRFLIRHCLKLNFHPDPDRQPTQARDARGRQVRQEWGWVGSARDRRRLYVRRITLTRPGEETIFLLTNLLDAEAFPAGAILDLYAERWQIERLFQQVTEVFELQRLIGSSPQAAILQASICLTLYNIIQLIRGYVAEAKGVPTEMVSSEMVFRDVQKEMICWAKLGPTPLPPRVATTPTEPDSIRSRLRTLIAGQWSDSWIKSPAKTKWKPTAKVRQVKGGHSSAWKLLNEAKQPSQKKTRKSE
jgi:hypothetical protein